MADEATKRCTKCREVKPVSAYSWQEKKRNYRHPRCRVCRKADSRKYYLANRDYKLMKNMEWYNANREAHIARVVARRDPVQHRAYQAARRANGLYRQGRMSVKYRKILEDYGMVCWICAKEIVSLTDLEFDHMIPLARGGEHREDNILPAHRRCNRSKGYNY